ncbi:hypothetical protein PFICI_04824 [Pestalotiopsis fici W106-1]|uniref:Uncharacterized protein n=1 Tax=Pestalotiopsis fici (strain W106-1 / CGMCC3.15140) TaxID=1229662 RepID=W3XA10_PESFW|nr:uncharacterized protein PFICI_04824 [Pestalotiopsis fici W106-1]ETS82948.1 hypothetical protein PFICI_04824 [Pestalotiopsis fici W106-1]
MDGPSMGGGSRSIPIIIITGCNEEGDGACYQSRYINIIPTTGRCVYSITTSGGQRFRPAPEPANDPYRHDGTISSSSHGDCRIVECQYCALCKKHRIASHALQEKLIGRSGGANSWDPYFHWIMNEQIPLLGPDSPSKGGINWGLCWIQNCHHCKNIGSASTKPANTNRLGCPCKRVGSEFGCECGRSHDPPGTIDLRFLPHNPLYPLTACRRWTMQKFVVRSIRKNPCCWCAEMSKRLAAQFDDSSSDSDNQKVRSQQEVVHNLNLYERIAYILSPFATEFSDFKKEKGYNHNDFFFNLPESAVPVPPPPPAPPLPEKSAATKPRRQRSLSVEEQHDFEQLMFETDPSWGHAIRPNTQPKKRSLWQRITGG